MSSQHPGRVRFQSLDVWRGVACLLVIVFHGVFAFDAPPDAGQLDRGLRAVAARLWIGVPMFFVISGYCISGAADGVRRRHTGIPNYAWRRFRRIYPPAWIVLIVSCLLVALVDMLLAPQALTSAGVFLRPWWLDASQWFGNLTLTETWRYHLYGKETKAVYLGHYWTLCYEEQFYAVMGVLLLVAPRRLFAGAVAVTIAGAALRWALNANGIATDGFFFDGQWLFFAMGVLVFHSVNYGSPTLRVAAAAALCLALVYALAQPGELLEIEKNYRRETLIAGGFALLLLATYRWDERIMQTSVLRPLALAGQMCYSLYLVHLPVIRFLRGILEYGGFQTAQFPAAATIALCAFASVAVSWPFYMLVERHFLNTQHGSPDTATASANGSEGFAAIPVAISDLSSSAQ